VAGRRNEGEGKTDGDGLGTTAEDAEASDDIGAHADTRGDSSGGPATPPCGGAAEAEAADELIERMGRASRSEKVGGRGGGWGSATAEREEKGWMVTAPPAAEMMATAADAVVVEGRRLSGRADTAR
jgi:hypothetical protein